MQPRFVQDVGERRLTLFSEVRGPIERLTFLRKALLFAELAMIAYNDESQIDGLSMRSFDLATACLFDQQSRKVVRVFDGGNSRRVADYLHVELSEHTDSTLSMYASRIAALR